MRGSPMIPRYVTLMGAARVSSLATWATVRCVSRNLATRASVNACGLGARSSFVSTARPTIIEFAEAKPSAMNGVKSVG